MKTLWNASDRLELCSRLGRLSPDAERKWGRMSAPQMLAHVVDCMRMSLGDLRVPSKNLPLRFTPIKQVVIYLLPFPKSAPTAPEVIARPPVDWPSECRSLTMLFEQFAARERSSPDWPDHPAFGRLTGNTWGVLMYRHTDHHFRQFGV